MKRQLRIQPTLPAILLRPKKLIVAYLLYYIFCPFNNKQMKQIYYLLLLLIFIIGCEKDSYDGFYEYDIIGKWKWVESCGGFSGDCWYPTLNHREQVEFTSSHQYIRTINGIESFILTYTLGGSYESGGIKYYEISFSNGWSTVYWFIDKNTFEMPGGDFVEKFKRVKYNNCTQ
jgi:hypothetical protein